MRIVGDSLGKKYNTNWIFRNLSFEVKHGQSLAIIGPNGSGKSTLLQIAINALTPSKGKVTFHQKNSPISSESASQQINFSSPYSELIEEFTLLEHLKFHSRFRNSLLPLEEVIEKIGYANARNKLISEFSSGMKQRLKLALCFYFEGSILALDEPTSNLDSKGIDWYHNLIGENKNRTVLIASNQRYEYEFCQNHIDLIALNDK